MPPKTLAPTAKDRAEAALVAKAIVLAAKVHHLAFQATVDAYVRLFKVSFKGPFNSRLFRRACKRAHEVQIEVTFERQRMKFAKAQET